MKAKLIFVKFSQFRKLSAEHLIIKNEILYALVVGLSYVYVCLTVGALCGIVQSRNGNMTLARLTLSYGSKLWGAGSDKKDDIVRNVFDMEDFRTGILFEL